MTHLRVSRLVGLSALLAMVLLFFHLRDAVSPDSFDYQFYAMHAQRHGLLTDIGTLRTYAYPMFLSWLVPLTGPDLLRLPIAAGVVQWIIYASGCVALLRCVPRIEATWRTAVGLGLLLNPWLIAQVTDTLTEGLLAGVWVWTAALTWRSLGAVHVRAFAAHVAVASLLVAVTVVIRPGSIPVAAGWAAAMLVSLAFRPAAWRERLARLALFVVLAAIGCAAAWGPQLAYNVKVSGRLAFPVICQLGDLQMAWGMYLWKYDTLLHPDATFGPWYFPNPLLAIAPPVSPAWKWYVQFPLAGVLTIGAHLFNSLSVNDLFTIVHVDRSWFRWPLRALYWVLFILAGRQFATSARQLWRSSSLSLVGTTPGALVLYALLGVLGTSLVNGAAAVEVRFALFPIAVLSVCGTHQLLRLASGTGGPGPIQLATLLALCVLAMLCTGYMDRLGTRYIPAGPAFSMDQCSRTRNPDPGEWNRWLAADPPGGDARRLMRRSGP